MGNTKLSLKPIVLAILLASAFPAFSQVQIPDEVATDSTIRNQWPSNLNWTPECSDSQNCKSYAGTADASKLETIDYPSIDDIKVSNSLGFQLDSSVELKNKTVYVTDVTGIEGFIFGASNNNGYVDSSFMPSHTAEGNLLVLDISNKNQVDVSGCSLSQVNANITAAANSKGGAVNNSTLIRNGNFNVKKTGNNTPAWTIAGAGVYEATDNVNNNMVVVDNTTLTMDPTLSIPNAVSIFGAYTHRTSEGGQLSINGNSVWIKDSNIETFLIAGSLSYAGNFASGNQNSVYVSNSSLKLNSSNLGNFIGGIFSTWGTGKAENNWLEIEGSQLQIDAYAENAFTISPTWATDSALNNALVIRDTTIISESKALQILGGYAGLEEANQNTIVISNSTIEGALTFYGGYTSKENSASGNRIYLSNVTISDGAVLVGGKAVTQGVNATASDNLIVMDNLKGKDNSRVTFNRVLGGAIGSEGYINNNTLITSSGFNAETFGGFQHYQFIVDQNSFKDGAFISVTGNAGVVLQPTGANQSTIAIGGTNLDLSPGSSYTLISSAGGFKDTEGNALTASTDLNGMKQDMVIDSTASLVRIEHNEISKDDYDLAIDGNDLNMVVESSGTSADGVNPETDVLMQASIASLASLFAADDLLVDTALKSRSNTRLDGPFAAMRAGTWSHDATSRFETDVYSGLLGWALHASDVEFGPFIEMGRGNYKMDDGASGHHNYVGAGIYANWETPFYVRLTGYLKGGAMENNFETKLVGQSFDFDNTSAYWGAHIGANVDINVTEKLRARPFVSYFYDGRESETFTKHGGVVDGSKFDFDTINAHRVQVGSMFEYAYTDTSRPYFGITYEQVIKAEAEGAARDAQGKLSLNSSDVEGATGIISAGWSYLNSQKDFEFNFGVNGYGGTRNGVSAQMNAGWRF